MKKITSFLALFLMFLGVSLQASADALPQLTEDPANPKWYYIQSYRSGKYLGHNADGQVLQVADFNEASLWYFLKSGDAVLLCNGSEGNLQYTTEHKLAATGTPMYVVQHNFNDCGLSICKNPTIQGGDCIDANNNNDNIGWWAPNAGDNQGTTWRIKSLTDLAQNIESGVDSKQMGTYADTPEVRAALEEAKANPNEPAAFVKFVNETMPTLTVKMPVEGKTYIVKSCYEEYFKKQGVEKALCDDTTKPMWNTLDRTNKSFYWNIVPTTDGYTFQNVSSNKFIKALGEVADAADAAATIKMEAVGGNKWKLTLNGAAMHTNGHGSGAGVSGNIVKWYADPLGACQWYVEEAEFTEPTDVVYDYYVDNEKVYSQTASQMIGTDFVVPYTNAFFDATIETTGKVQKGSVVKVVCQEKNVPFVATTDTKNPVWYIVDIHGQNRYWNATAEEGKVKTPEVKAESNLIELPKADYQWCFVGNAITGYKIYNQAKGFDVALTNAKDYVNFAAAEQAIAWKLVASTAFEGAICFSDGTTNINHQEVDQNGGTLKYWNAADAGSSCRFYTVAQLKENAANALITNAENQNLAPAGYVGSSIYLSNAENAKAYATALANLKANKTDAAAFDALQAEYDKVVAAGAIAIEPNKYYRLQNVKRVNTGILTVGADGVLTNEDSNISNANNIWKFTKLENGKYNLVNANFGMGITEPSAHKIAAESAAEYELIDQTAGQFSLKSGNFLVQYQDQVGEIGSWGSAEKGGDGAWYIIPATELEVSMNKAEGAAESWSTIYLPFDVTLPNGVKAYQAAAPVAGAMSLTEVTTVPANNAVILNGQETKYTLNIAPATENKLVGNVLVGSNVESDQDAAKGTYMVLSKDVDGNVGLFKAPADMKLGANKAYYIYNEAAAVNGLKFVFGETTGVEGVEVETENAVFYDLSGRRVANPVKGIYVKNGKKVYVK